MALTVRENFNPGTTFNPNNLSQRYIDLRYNLLTALEGFHNDPYYDSVGLLTMGIGFNIADDAVLSLVLQEFGVQAQLQTFHNIIHAGGSLATVRSALDSQLGSPFTLTDAQIRSVFDALAISKENTLTSTYTSVGNMPESYERAVMFSLVYNSGALIGPALSDALNQDNRAEAWYEIRYNSNKQGKNFIQNGVVASGDTGIAKRRFVESEVFGLYKDANNISLDEAKLAYQMFSLHREYILLYENAYGSLNTGLVGSRGNMISVANADPNITAIVTVETVIESFDLAEVKIVEWVNGQLPSGVSPLNAGDFISTNIYLDAGRGAATQSIDPNHASTLDATLYKSGAEHDQRNLLIGEGGNDTLIGDRSADVLLGGDGDDTLIGGKGDDILIGGAGQDTYVINSGDGPDIIIDADRSVLVRDGQFFTGAFVRDAGTSTWRFVTDAGVSISINSPAVLSFGNGDTVTFQDLTTADLVNQNLAGVRLVAEAAAGAITREIIGDLAPEDQDLGQPGVQVGYDDLGNVIVDPNTPEPGRADTLYGSAGADHLDARGGEDVIDALGGDDRIEGGSGRDSVTAGDGNDLIEAGAGADIVDAGAGDDRVYAEREMDLVAAYNAGLTDAPSGQKGDWLAGGSGNDWLVAGADDDVLTGGAGQDILMGGAGDDSLLGDAEWVAQSFDWTYTDTPSGRVFSPVVGELEPLGGASDVLYAGAGNDWVRAGAGADVVYGDSGNDDINGEEDGDFLFGGEGDDILHGDASYRDPATHGNDHLDGGSGNDYLQGHGGDDVLAGGAGDDTLIGDADDDALPGVYHGRDDLSGGTGHDTLVGGGNADRLVGGDGNDWLYGDDDAFNPIAAALHGDDTLDGGAGDDALFGDGGNDTLLGGEGADQLVGGAGNDILDGGSGTDTLFGEAGRDILIGGEDDDRLQGGEDDDTLEGGEGIDILLGEAGHDTLTGGTGRDTLQGGSGDDVYVFNAGDGYDGDYIFDTEGANRIEFAEGSGPLEEAVIYNSTTGASSVYLTYGDSDVVVLGLPDYNRIGGITAGDGSAFQATKYLANGMDEGGGSDDTVYRLDTASLRYAPNFALTVADAGGLDESRMARLTDRAGVVVATPQLSGVTLEGNDAVVGLSILEGSTAVATGTLRIRDHLLNPIDAFSVYNTALYTEAGALAHAGLYLSSQYAGWDWQTRSSGASETRVLISGDAEDNLLNEATFPALTAILYGGAGNDILRAASGTNTLIGGAGDDRMQGKQGTNTYHVDPAERDVVENIRTFITDPDSAVIVLPAGTVIANLAFARDGEDLLIGSMRVLKHFRYSNDNGVLNPNRVRYLKVDGTADLLDLPALLSAQGVSASVSGTAYDDTLAGDDNANLIDALAGSDVLYGFGGNDTLLGGADNDTLDGGAGEDQLTGGGGDDVYVVDSAGDIVTEAAGQGVDTVQSSVTFALGAEVENLTLTDSAAIDGTGNALDNVIVGNSAANTLTGGAGNDILDGGDGSDRMVGGGGDDTYYVTRGAFDTVIENAGEGTDTIISSEFSNTLPAYVENLTVDTGGWRTSNPVVREIGNSLDNVIRVDGSNRYTLYGNAGDDRLYGGSNIDWLDGGAGADYMEGGGGFNTYIVDSAGDVVVGPGVVKSSVTFALSGATNNLVLTGTGALNGTGNALNNSLTGNSGTNTLTGGAGDDTYVIQNTSDVVFESPGEGVDRIVSSVAGTVQTHR